MAKRPPSRSDEKKAVTVGSDKRGRVDITLEPSLFLRTMFSNQQTVHDALKQLAQLKKTIFNKSGATVVDDGGWHMDVRINHFLKNFTFMTIGGNGSVGRMDLLEENIHEYVVVKTSLFYEYNSLFLEYHINMTLNSLRRLIPNFAMALMLVTCTSASAKQLCDATVAGAVPRDYMFIEAVRPGTPLGDKDLNADESELLTLFIQILFALHVAQTQLRFTHWDLHDENVLIEAIPDVDYQTPVFVYNIEGKVYHVPVLGKRIPVIVDFGSSRVDGIVLKEQENDNWVFSSNEDMQLLWQYIKLKFNHGILDVNAINQKAKNAETPLEFAQILMETTLYKDILATSRQQQNNVYYAWLFKDVRGRLDDVTAKRLGITFEP